MAMLSLYCSSAYMACASRNAAGSEKQCSASQMEAASLQQDAVGLLFAFIRAFCRLCHLLGTGHAEGALSVLRV